MTGTDFQGCLSIQRLSVQVFKTHHPQLTCMPSFPLFATWGNRSDSSSFIEVHSLCGVLIYIVQKSMNGLVSTENSTFHSSIARVSAQHASFGHFDAECSRNRCSTNSAGIGGFGTATQNINFFIQYKVLQTCTFRPQQIFDPLFHNEAGRFSQNRPIQLHTRF